MLEELVPVRDKWGEEGFPDVPKVTVGICGQRCSTFKLEHPTMAMVVVKAYLDGSMDKWKIITQLKEGIIKLKLKVEGDLVEIPTDYTIPLVDQCWLLITRKASGH